MSHHRVPASFLAILLVANLPRFASTQTIHAPTPATQPAGQTVSQKIAASKTLLDINTATPDQLNALPGMGNAYTQRIVAGRPYTAKNQLTTRGVIPPAAYEKIKDQIIAHRPKG
jgi:DNA uptake protein ComE-like DNA-binding protein